ncbi:hypothetical protein HU200_067014 [Digitaria exilis]|uniref:Uncharacterized protein n=1 Tax=Digitaria exilis TaxID=1010633 RepID=A0A834ZZB8_9POAL|nr:hypothetical protein HU200_067014 [Digitaria exilis]
MYAPNLETVKIRGCWSLKSLPYVGRGSNNKVVECDCEKEWWDRLEWEDSSQANRYKPIHSRYYKKTMLRASVLRSDPNLAKAATSLPHGSSCPSITVSRIELCVAMPA